MTFEHRAAVFLVLLVYLGITAAAAAHYRRTEGWYSTVLVFSVGAFAYYFAIPIEATFVGEDLPRGLYVPGTKALAIVVLATTALLGFWAGYALSGFTRRFPRTDPAERSKPEQPPPSFRVFAMGSFLLAAIVVPPRLDTLLSYSTAYGTTYANPTLSIALFWSLSCCAIMGTIALLQPRPRWKAGAVLLLIPMVWGLLSGDKNPVLLALLGAGAALWSRRRGTFFRLFAVVVAAALLSTLLPVFSIWRAGVPLDQIGDRYYFSFARLDMGGPMFSLLSHLDEPGGRTYGLTWFDNLWQWVPRSVWPGRPPDLAERFAREQLRDWRPGHGMGFSLLAEGWMAFRWAGPFLQYLLLGVVWGLGWRGVAVWIAPGRPLYFRALYLSLGYYLLILMHRAPTTGTSKPIIQFMFPLLLLTLIVDGPGARRRRRPKKRRA